MDNTKPYLIQLKKNSDKGGDLSFLDEQLPFSIKRIYWLYNLNEVDRGGHAHTLTDRVIVCLHKSLRITLTDTGGNKHKFRLNKPDQALFYPKMHWIDLHCEEGAIMLAAASTSYEDDVYIRSYDDFLAHN